MAITATDMMKKVSARSFYLTVLISSFSFASDWQFEPSIKLDGTYSDNIRLTPNNEKASLVNQTSILFDSSYKSKYADFSFTSDSSYATYSHDHDLDDDYHTLNGNFDIQLWPNGISLVGTANISNQARNGSRNSLADIVSADTVRVEDYNSGLEYNVNNSNLVFNSYLGYQTISSADDIGNREGLTANIDTKNGVSARHVFWDVQHNYQKLKSSNNDGKLSESELKLGLITSFKINPFIRYYNEDNSGNINNSDSSIESNSYGLGVRWLISSTIYLDTSFNEPIGNKLDLDGRVQKSYIDAAIRWEPSERTSLSASVSERFYGNSYGFNFSHRNKRLENSISYIENIQAFTRNSFSPILVGFFLVSNFKRNIEHI